MVPIRGGGSATKDGLPERLAQARAAKRTLLQHGCGTHRPSLRPYDLMAFSDNVLAGGGKKKGGRGSASESSGASAPASQVTINVGRD